MFEVILFAAVCLCAVVLLVCRFALPHLARRNPEPWYLDYARSFFPVLLLVFLLRGFVAEPFRIPSGSMYPTLEIGDFLLVNKFAYGFRLPIVHTKVVSLGNPERGDIVVFRYPPNPKQNYIKRLIGLPGDQIRYESKKLYVNGVEVVANYAEPYTYTRQNGGEITASRFDQVIPATEGGQDVSFATLQFGDFNLAAAQSWTVPDGHYFMMGDNRDNSADSRRWGFVPDENIVGKAFFIWMNVRPDIGWKAKLGRVGTDIQAQPAAEAGTN